MPDKPNNHLKVEILLKYFEAARTNIISRLSLRDNCILLCLGAVAGIMTAAFAGSPSDTRFDVLLVIPIVSLVVAVFVSQHNFMMDKLYVYIVMEVQKPLKDLGITAWEVSTQYTDSRKYSYWLRFIGEVAVILFPAFFSLFTSFSNAPHPRKLSIHILLFVDLVATVGATIIVIMSALRARRHLSEIDPTKPEPNHAIQRTRESRQA